MTLEWRAHEMLPRTLYIMWPVQLQSLKMLHPMFKEMHLQKNIIWLLTLGSKSHETLPMWPMHLQSLKLIRSYWLGDAFTRKNVIWLLTFSMGSRSHKTLPCTLYIMWPMLLFDLIPYIPVNNFQLHRDGPSLVEPVLSKDQWHQWGLNLQPSASSQSLYHGVTAFPSDLCASKVWSCYIQTFRRYNYKNSDG